jgi:hypothetical protein
VYSQFATSDCPLKADRRTNIARGPLWADTVEKVEFLLELGSARFVFWIRWHTFEDYLIWTNAHSRKRCMFERRPEGAQRHDVSVPLLGTSFVEAPQISGGRSIVHFTLFLLCLYFGFICKSKA